MGSSGQTELNDSDIVHVKVLNPDDIPEQNRILQSAQTYENSSIRSRDDHRSNLEKTKKGFLEALVS